MTEGVIAGGLARSRDDCWNRIGVRGDRSCPELERYSHCHHCPVFAAAAGTLLERELPAGYAAEWTRHFANPRPLEERSLASVIVFRLGTEWFGLPTAVVQEVATLRPIHSLPHRNGGVVLGLANIRGELMVCVALGRVVGLDESPESDRKPASEPQRRLLVIAGGTVRAACPVDEVQGIHRFHPRELKDVPATVSKGSAPYSKAVLSWRRRVVGLLDDRRLFESLERSLA